MNQILIQSELVTFLRSTLNEKGLKEVMIPPLVQNPGVDLHVHPFSVCGMHNQNHQAYLHTSPEFAMKSLLSDGFEDIYYLGYVFRDEPNSPFHRPQFLMLEWYRTHKNYYYMMDEVESIVKSSIDFIDSCHIELVENLKNSTPQRVTVRELFYEFLKIDILDFLKKEDLCQLIQNNHKDVPLPNDFKSLDWDDLFFLLYLNKIEPHLINYPFLILYEYPAPLAALSQLCPKNPKVSQRFEVYLNGLELCNCYGELTDLKTQDARAKMAIKGKQDIYNYHLTEPKVLLDALRTGLPTSTGASMGIERLHMALTGEKDLFFPKKYLGI